MGMLQVEKLFFTQCLVYVFPQAEESCMADEDNQGNTLVSVAPLNPPDSQEKPSQNGESLEAVKTQNPPAATNGHSTTKADTELWDSIWSTQARGQSSPSQAYKQH